MATEPDVLRLTVVCPPPDEGGLEVRPIVNGKDLLADASPRDTEAVPRYGGVGPRYLLGLDGRLHATAIPRRIRLAVSGCGVEMCCGALYVTVRRDAEQVVWSSWSDSVRGDPDLPELRFAADQYEAEVRRAEADRSWVWPGAMVAMLLEAELKSREDWLARWDCDLEGVWAARRSPEQIELLLTYPRDCFETDRPWLQFGIILPISSEDPEEQAAELGARLTAGDPRAVAEVWGGSHDAEQLGYPWPPVVPWEK